MTGPRRTTAKGNARREALLAAAERLFAARGYSNTSVQDVAEAVGLLKGSIYYYVTSKEDLLFQVLLRNHRELRAYVTSDLAGGDPLRTVHEFMRRHVRYVLEHIEVSALYSGEQASIGAVDEWRRAINTERREHENALIAVLTEAEESGRAHLGESADLTAKALLSMANATHRWYQPGGEYSADDVALHHAGLAVRAVEVPGPNHRVSSEKTL